MGDDILKRGNLLWEGSRMMLPEHKAEILEHRRQLQTKERPFLDDIHVEVMERCLKESLHTGKPVAITIYDPYEDEVLQGVVQRLDETRRQIDIEGRRIPFSDVIDVRNAAL